MHLSRSLFARDATGWKFARFPRGLFSSRRGGSPDQNQAGADLRARPRAAKWYPNRPPPTRSFAAGYRPLSESVPTFRERRSLFGSLPSRKQGVGP